MTAPDPRFAQWEKLRTVVQGLRERAKQLGRTMHITLSEAPVPPPETPMWLAPEFIIVDDFSRIEGSPTATGMTNLLPPHEACPKCGERRRSEMYLADDLDTFTCQSCGTAYAVPASPR